MTLSGSPEDRAAAGWIVADEIMRERTGGRERSYGKWLDATLNGVKLTGKDHVLVEHFAKPVFEAAAAKKEHNHGLAGYVGEWLWYLLTRDLPQDPARSVEILGPPKAAVNDGGGDGLIVYREDGTARGFSFRLWEMKKYTGKANRPDGAIYKGWTQLSTRGRPTWECSPGATNCSLTTPGSSWAVWPSSGSMRRSRPAPASASR
ncbi:hypothetical protein [Streptomyces sp. NBC_00162]|uniref:hypothetical protein n=1 Tax=Streptomyces sp. NBC_00162 TaxID=2903629 RepID=UPI00214BEDE3|nr:hypothetical protein [Streptomyces sp. NBC_00162]UUU37517.1 hypothetical protein JIW86_00360 [Streptomyces sp. NBC_00162]